MTFFFLSVRKVYHGFKKRFQYGQSGLYSDITLYLAIKIKKRVLNQFKLFMKPFMRDIKVAYRYCTYPPLYSERFYTT